MALPQSMLPALVAAFFATKYSDFRWYLALLAIIGVAFAHLSLNLFDDYFDFKNAEQGDRSALAREGFRAMTVKCPPLVDGTVSPRKWFLVACLFALIAVCFGVPVFLIRGMRILWIVLAVAVIGLFYSAPPLKLGYHGLGELIIGGIFGPALGIGMSIAASGEFHISEVIISICLGLFVINILYVHSIMDYAADMKAGKKTLAWLAHNDTVRYIILAFINFAPYVFVILGVIFKVLSLYMIICVFAIPWNIALFASMLRFKKDQFAPVEWKGWYGPSSMWEEIRKAGIDWFMQRWLLARNANSVFCILCIIASIAIMIVKFTVL
ncbi:MAG: prenyltransferase [Lachnospiraceae bacterium]|nr:prenyltransferase [Lachnospiraceae bacterium]